MLLFLTPDGHPCLWSEDRGQTTLIHGTSISYCCDDISLKNPHRIWMVLWFEFKIIYRNQKVKSYFILQKIETPSKWISNILWSLKYSMLVTFLRPIEVVSDYDF